MIILDRMLTGSIKFVLGKIAAAVEQELDDDESLRRLLLEAQMRAELGELSREELQAIEADIMVRLREIQEQRGGGAVQVVGEGMQVTGVEAELTADEFHEEAAPVVVKKAKAPARKGRKRRA